MENSGAVCTCVALCSEARAVLLCSWMLGWWNSSGQVSSQEPWVHMDLDSDLDEDVAHHWSFVLN